jgi:hypothetical protein
LVAPQQQTGSRSSLNCSGCICIRTRSTLYLPLREERC